jgi:8-oxo-dGTP diphosphatase
LGGKLEPDEDVCAGMRREIDEEAGIACDRLELAGTVSWPGFGPDGENWFAFVFRIPAWSGVPRERNHEGTLVWVEVDQHFLPLVFGSTRQFHAVMPYAGGRPTGWHYSTL